MENTFLKNISFVFISILVGVLVVHQFLIKAPSSFKEEVLFSIENGDSLRKISGELKNLNLIRSRSLFETLVILYGGEKHILPGDYLLKESSPVYEIANNISEGKRNFIPVKLTIPEGFSNLEIAELASIKIKGFNSDKFLSLAKDKQGYLFPDTYYLFPGDDEESLFNLMSSNYKEQTSKVREDILKVNKTEQDIIIMASIIEEEAIGDIDRNLISGILWNRLKINMPLQVDAAPETYKSKGLPKEPISNPGLESIKAAIYPEASEYIFYLHGKDGMIHFAKNFEEHKKNKFKYLR